MKTNLSTFNYNYAAVEPTFLSVIDFLTNGTVNRIICDDDRINCNFLALSYSLNLGQIPFISLYSIFLKVWYKKWIDVDIILCDDSAEILFSENLKDLMNKHEITLKIFQSADLSVKVPIYLKSGADLSQSRYVFVSADMSWCRFVLVPICLAFLSGRAIVHCCKVASNTITTTLYY